MPFFPPSLRLCEPKKDLIARVVKIIGKRKAIELLMETAEVEQNGGLFIVVRKMGDIAGLWWGAHISLVEYLRSTNAQLSRWTGSPRVLCPTLAPKLA